MSKRQNISSASPFEQIIGLSRAVRIGQHIAVSGTAPIGDDGKTVGVGDAYAQTKRCIEIAKRALEHAGSQLEDVIRTRVFLIKIEDWKEAARAHKEAFEHIRPATTFVQAAGFVNPEWLVEIEVDAIISETKQKNC